MKTWERALVTGSSSGIGRAMAQYLAAAGTQVVLVARNEKELEKTAETAPERMQIMPADLTKSKDLKLLEEYLNNEPIDLLVNNAGLGGRMDNFSEHSLKYISSMLELNIDALVRLCRAAVPKMLERKKGDILNVSSIASVQPVPYETVYAATKAFVTSFSQGLYEELKPHGINVTALLPGLVRTNFFEAGGSDSVENLPGFMWMDPWPVAEIALQAVSKGKPIVVPGAMNKVLASLVDLTPRPVRRTFASAAQKYRVRKKD